MPLSDMHVDNNIHPLRPFLRKAAIWLVMSAILIAAFALAGWLFTIDFLKRPLPYLVAMNPLTATGLFLLGFLTLSDIRREKTGTRKIISFIILTALLVFTMLILLDNMLHWNLNLDRVLFSNKLAEDPLGPDANSMAPGTAVCFILTCLSLLFTESDRYRKSVVAQVLSACCAMVAMIVILGYLYNVKEFSNSLSSVPMALHTAFAFFVLSLSILFIEPEKGLMRHFTGTFPSSFTGRFLLTSAFFIPFFFGTVILAVRRKYYINEELSIALLVISIMLVFFLVIVFNTRLISRKERAIKLTEAALRERTVELAFSNKQLLKTNSNLEQFTSVASHDLQEPLRKINVFTDLLVKNSAGLDDEGKLYLEKIQKSATRMSKLINDLLEFARLKVNQKDFLPTDLNKILNDIMVDYELLAKQTNAEINIDILPVIEAGAVEMNQLFYNLIGNALKFSNKDRQCVINISCTIPTIAELHEHRLPEQTSFCKISVLDNGIGFDQEYADRIFEIFQRLHGRQEYAGTGIGLALAKKIVENHGGAIQAYSQEGEGAAFHVYLPVIRN